MPDGFNFLYTLHVQTLGTHSTMCTWWAARHMMSANVALQQAHIAPVCSQHHILAYVQPALLLLLTNDNGVADLHHMQGTLKFVEGYCV